VWSASGLLLALTPAPMAAMMASAMVLDRLPLFLSSVYQTALTLAMRCPLTMMMGILALSPTLLVAFVV
jgi:hypothetical protein